MSDATELALRALRHRDRSRRDIENRLERAGIAEDERARALDDLSAAGLLSDDRFAHERAQQLAKRNASNALIRSDLRHHGIAAEVVEEVVDGLEPEEERAAGIFRQRGGGDRALRYLAGKGFARDSLESLTDDDPVH
ncbi:MAG: RecX family transcriptional regulator [Actinomycetota bacterium]|nr:RecX family transcriptional regulator [Actinomycetota bacterium]